MSSAREGLARSLQAKLSQHAKRIGADPNLVLTRYAVERYLYRLSRSAHTEKFVLKGALLMFAWMGDTFRPTRDADMLGFGDVSPESLAKIFAEVCAVPVEPDAMTYLADTLRLEPIRLDDDYGGHRATLMARMGAARLRVQVDIGVGDAIMATFQRRNTVVPDTWPVGLTPEFAGDVVKRRQWDAFLEKSRVAGPTLAAAIDAIQQLLSEPLKLARTA